MRGLPEKNRSPQDGDTLLYRALWGDDTAACLHPGGHAALVDSLLTKGADKEAKNKVRGGGGRGDG